jgi:hypothetical protein
MCIEIYKESLDQENLLSMIRSIKYLQSFVFYSLMEDAMNCYDCWEDKKVKFFIFISVFEWGQMDKW